MCGCGCELGLALAVCQAEEAKRPPAPQTAAVEVPRIASIFECVMMNWLACLVGDTPMQRLSRGSGR